MELHFTAYTKCKSETENVTNKNDWFSNLLLLLLIQCVHAAMGISFNLNN